MTFQSHVLFPYPLGHHSSVYIYTIDKFTAFLSRVDVIIDPILPVQLNKRRKYGTRCDLECTKLCFNSSECSDCPSSAYCIQHDTVWLVYLVFYSDSYSI